MNTRFLRIAAFSAVILLLVGIGAYVTYYLTTPVQKVRIYEVPDSGVPNSRDGLPIVEQGTTLHTQPENGDTSPAGVMTDNEHQQIHEELANKKRKLEELKRELAERKLEYAEFQRRREDLEAAKAFQEQAMRQELEEIRELSNWLKDFGHRTRETIAEVGFLLDSNLTREEFVQLYPDPADREYYYRKLRELERSTDQLTTRLANASEPVRKRFLDAIREKWTSTWGADTVDELINDVARKAKG